MFLVDVDNTLLDNDGVRDGIQDHLEREVEAWRTANGIGRFRHLFVELGYRDYFGALQRFRVEHPYDVRLLSIGAFLMDYPFADRLYPESLDVLDCLTPGGRRPFCRTATWCSSHANSSTPALLKR